MVEFRKSSVFQEIRETTNQIKLNSLRTLLRNLIGFEKKPTHLRVLEGDFIEGTERILKYVFFL